MRALRSTFIAVIIAALPIAALADYHYTFHVPVTISNVPAGSSVGAACTLFAGPDGTGQNLRYQTSPSVQLPVFMTGYKGTMTVQISSPTKPQSYQCYVMVSKGTTIENLDNGSPTSPAAGWTGTMVASGNIP